MAEDQSSSTCPRNQCQHCVTIRISLVFPSLTSFLFFCVLLVFTLSWTHVRTKKLSIQWEYLCLPFSFLVLFITYFSTLSQTILFNLRHKWHMMFDVHISNRLRDSSGYNNRYLDPGDLDPGMRKHLWLSHLIIPTSEWVWVSSPGEWRHYQTSQVLTNEKPVSRSRGHSRPMRSSVNQRLVPTLHHQLFSIWWSH